MADNALWDEPVVPGLRRDIEACLFVSGAPLSVEALLAAVSGDDGVSIHHVQAALQALATEFPVGGSRGFELVELAGGWAFRTNPECENSVSALFELPDDASRLSPAAMEALAIVAYLQPISRPQISEIRGVNSDSPLQRLLERELITEVGRCASGSGAVTYGTTERFEVMFGLSGLDQLPDLEGFALGEEQKEELSRRLGLLSTPE